MLAIQPGDVAGLLDVLAKIDASDERMGVAEPHILADAALLQFVGNDSVTELHEKLAAYFE